MKLTVGWWQISVQRVYPTYDQLKSMYDDAARCWHHQILQLGYFQAYRSLFESLRASEVIAIPEDATVCDCGIGTAAFSLALAQIENQLNVTGVDISPQMLLTARQNLQQARINAKVTQANIVKLPFADNSFDLVIAAHILEHLPEPIVGLREIVRVLKPQTPFILSVSRRGLLSSCVQLHWGNNCITQKYLAEIMAEAGLKDIRFQQFPFGLARLTSYACWGFKQ